MAVARRDEMPQIGRVITGDGQVIDAATDRLRPDVERGAQFGLYLTGGRPRHVIKVLLQTVRRRTARQRVSPPVLGKCSCVDFGN